jgi:hypothetical protein
MKTVALISAVGFGLLLAMGSTAAVPEANNFRTLSGYWTCPTCEANGLEGTYEQCEAQGHKHALKLPDGQYVYFLENERSTALIQGSRKHGFPITVCGFYDARTRTIDVDAYKIDNLWTSWCAEHQQMDTCRATKAHTVPEKLQARN